MIRMVSRRRGISLPGQYHSTPTIPINSEPLSTSRWTTTRSSVGLKPQKSFKARKIDTSSPARSVTGKTSPAHPPVLRDGGVTDSCRFATAIWRAPGRKSAPKRKLKKKDSKRRIMRVRGPTNSRFPDRSRSERDHLQRLGDIVE